MKHETSFTTVHRSGIFLETVYSSNHGPINLLPSNPRFRLPTVKSARAGLIDGAAESGSGIRNLLRLYALATNDQIERGISWYPRVHDLSVDLGDHYGFPVRRVGGAISAVSPQISWRYNVICAALCCRVALEGGDITRPKIGQTYSNRRKAVAYLLDQQPFDGPKTNSFADNISHPNSSQRVTIDTHAIGAYLGIHITKTQFDAGRYPLVESDHQTAALKVGLLPCHFQAIAWIVWRETVKGYAPDSPIDAYEAIRLAAEYPI